MAYNYEYPGVNMNDYNNDWILNKIRELILEWNSVKGEFDSLKEEVEALKKWFDTLDISDELRAVINELIDSGRLDILLNSFIPYVTPEMFGAAGDGVSDDTDAFIKAVEAGKTIICHKRYKIGTLRNISIQILGCSGSELITDGIYMGVNGSLQNIKISGANPIIFDTSLFTENTLLNASIVDCTINASNYGILFNYTSNIGMFGVDIRNNVFIGGGISCIACELNQTSSGFPWLTALTVADNSNLNEVYNFFFYNAPRTTLDESWRDLFIIADFIDNAYQYKDEKTLYYMRIRGFHRCYIKSKTYDFPATHPFIYFDDVDGSVFIDRIPSTQSNKNAFTGVSGFENTILSIGQSELEKHRHSLINRLPSPTTQYSEKRAQFFFNNDGSQGIAISRDANSIGSYIAVDRNGGMVYGVATSNNPEWSENRVITSNNWFYGGQGQRPKKVGIGTVFFDQTNGKPSFYAGAEKGWVWADGTTAYPA